MVGIEIPFSPQELKGIFERWRKFRKKRIRITVVEGTKYDVPPLLIFKRVTEGTIDSIFELPPGIMLSEVTERWVREAIWPTVTTPREEPRSQELPYGEVKKSPKRFIPFKELGTFDFID